MKDAAMTPETEIRESIEAFVTMLLWLSSSTEYHLLHSRAHVKLARMAHEEAVRIGGAE